MPELNANRSVWQRIRQQWQNSWQILQDKKRLKFFVAYHLVYAYYWFLLKTVRIQKTGIEAVFADIEAGHCPIFAGPHLHLLVFLLAYDGKPCAFLASSSKDGELITHLLHQRGFSTARGSSSNRASDGLRELLGFIRQRVPVGVTFDGPKGPALEPKQGVAMCARAADGHVYFTYVNLAQGKKSFWGMHLKSWDRFVLPFPFARLEMVYEKIEGLPDKRDPTFQEKTLAEIRRRAFTQYAYLFE
ncbi:lysophospholipid acyltransferase family protein [Beggiatoa leptomitoformis]|uniref:DUF374 domain-containing protein n=1 Tax=Beggiatoa leptomitoformis TaxID=288004 RepID=A0A2N9YHE6_9GAMM|nr:DUF374 domain-containing protein [Beggiatoa leptomitoformis]AUI69952.1 DUF374 domain-containing protein [Beggiatoa leptomitoformis]QGX03656.1 DUF374 domain-containing protein [Beggiatoa leptomitoformis]